MPSVISLKHYHKVPRHKQVLSRKNVLIRDRHTCQYCGKTLAAAQLTLDHVLPESWGGESSWENLVAACYKCNHKKSEPDPGGGRNDVALPAQAAYYCCTTYAAARISRHIRADWD